MRITVSPPAVASSEPSGLSATAAGDEKSDCSDATTFGVPLKSQIWPASPSDAASTECPSRRNRTLLTRCPPAFHLCGSPPVSGTTCTVPSQKPSPNKVPSREKSAVVIWESPFCENSTLPLATSTTRTLLLSQNAATDWPVCEITSRFASHGSVTLATGFTSAARTEAAPPTQHNNANATPSARFMLSPAQRRSSP